MKYIYGPVQSRRLGLSLGVSLTPYKICNFDCVYCQLGRTKEKTNLKKEYVKPDDILNELKSWLAYNPDSAKQLNFITLSGMGEPTLNSRIAEIITEIRKISGLKIAVITNSSLLPDASVRQSIKEADLIVPSLDSVDEKIFRQIDRPGEAIHAEDVINGLINLRREFRGFIWLEVMLVKGLNDSLGHARKLKEAIERINPDKIQLNSPVRTSAEPGIEAVGKNKLEKIREILGNKCEIF